MKYNFFIEELDDILEEIQESDYYEENGPIYTEVANENGIAYSVDQFTVFCPDLNLSFSYGLAGENDGNDFEDITAVFEGNKASPDTLISIYSHNEIEYLVSRYMEESGKSTENIKCIIEVAE